MPERPLLVGNSRHDRDVRKLPFKDAPCWERDRRIRRNLAIAWALIALTLLLFYGLFAWIVVVPS